MINKNTNFLFTNIYNVGYAFYYYYYYCYYYYYYYLKYNLLTLFILAHDPSLVGY